MKPLCIYHGNCADGFGAAWAVRKALGDDVEFFAGTYQQDGPDVTDRDVFLVDFSYKSSVLKIMAQKANSVTVIDHHKTAEEDLRPLIDEGIVGGIFDMSKSGAMLAWEWFHPEKEPPTLIRHIQDRDLWQFKLPGTREIQAALFSYPYDFEVWDALMIMDLEQLHSGGCAIERKHFKDIEELLPATQRRMIIAGHNVPVANLPYIHSSDAGHQMAIGEPFAACYMDGPDGRTYSLRSSEDGIDVSDIAKMFGGGGHAKAAGFFIKSTNSEIEELTPAPE